MVTPRQASYRHHAGILEDRDEYQSPGSRRCYIAASRGVRGAEDSAPTSAEEEATEAVPVELESLGTQVVMAEAFRIDASPLPPLIGEQALEGTVVFKFVSVAAGLSIKDETIPVVSVAYGGNLKGDDYVA